MAIGDFRILHFSVYCTYPGANTGDPEIRFTDEGI